MDQTVVYKRYANRRLYDTEQSAYVSLKEVRKAIRQGKQVRVEAAGSGQDLTAYVLTQILVEDAKKRNNLLSPELLHLFIRYGDNLLAEFFQNYLREALAGFLYLHNMAGDQFKRWLSMGMRMPGVSPEKPSPSNPLVSMFDMFRPKDGGGQE